ncbi:MAG TPA: biliverdin-producing heme oxygenase [Bryobacteraceae bacterium]|nr:biliverdin-producing heme oxygenase [Bryobacteraceae bacterium]
MQLARPSPPSILERLKRETQPWHTAVENRMPIMRPEFGMPDYRALVIRFYGFYAPVERSLWRVSGLEKALPDWRTRRKVEWLALDLSALGLSSQQIADLPLCSRLPDLHDRPEALGCLYVLEGSTLGGQIIGRHLHAKLGLGLNDGARFFQSYVDQVGPMWKFFQRALLASPPEAHDRIIEAAVDTFECFHDWLAAGEPFQEASRLRECNSPSSRLKQGH